MNAPLRFRQVHLDFHTSPEIPDVGAAFDPDEFAATLDAASVNSVTCFARCHHGMLYYQSDLFPERVHPTLARLDLLEAQIAACHAKNIRVPIYVTVQWDEFTADRHREWLCLDEEGREYGTKPLEPGFYRWLDVFHPGYRQFLFDHVDEICKKMPVDGFFFDIVQPRPSLAKHWIDAMDAEGLNPESAADRQVFAVKVIREWEAEMAAFVRERAPDATIFFNSGHVGTKHRPTTESYTHYELESLPSGGWGYLHFPQAMRYARNLGHECLGMTGKFHTSWGDFGSYKNPIALEFECFHMLALGAKCSIGDQLPPSGKLDPTTYDLIGGVYGEVKKKELWCAWSQPVTDVALLTTEEFHDSAPDGGRTLENVLGAVRMLQELRVSFDIVDSWADLSKYRLAILPDAMTCSPELTAKLEAFVKEGGAVIATHKSGLNTDGKFASSIFGVEAVGDAPLSPDFLVPGVLGANLPKTGHVMYKRALETRPLPGAEVLAGVEEPYFGRDWRRFCSHKHTPSSGKLAAYPGAVGKGKVVYLAHPVFSLYFDCAPRWCKEIVGDALKRLLPDPVVEVEGPSTLIVALTHQPARRQYTLHLLSYIPERRGRAFDTIEEVFPLTNIPVTIRTPVRLGLARVVPTGDGLAVRREGNISRIVIPRIDGHAMIELAYE